MLRLFIGPALFSIAMGFLEAAVVVYLRLLYYPNGFDFPIEPVIAMEPNVILVEFFRELATIIMLLYVGISSGKTNQERFAFFLFCFAIWDLFYYVFLYLTLSWPSSLFTWDLLFLIPVPWIGPVITPVIISILMIVLSVVLVKSSRSIKKQLLSKVEWALLITGSIVVILSWVLDYLDFVYQKHGTFSIWNISNEEMNVLSLQYVPIDFYWKTFFLGTVLISLAIALFWKRSVKTQN